MSMYVAEFMVHTSQLFLVETCRLALVLALHFPLSPTPENHAPFQNLQIQTPRRG